MATSMDFSYFNSGPLPYQYQHTPTNEDFRYPEYDQSAGHLGKVDGNHLPPAPLPQEPYNPAFPHFHDAYFDPSMQNTRTPSVLQQSISPTFEAAPFISVDDGQLRSSSEDKDNAPPQQNKRKAQNRAAQRAFRERKEKHLKDLEAKLATLQKQSMNLDSENERLRKELAKVATENEILRATSSGSLDDDYWTQHSSTGTGTVPINHRPSNSTSTPRDPDISNRAKFSPLQTIVIDDSSGEPLLTAGQTWDYIQAHEKFKMGLVEVGDVCERLKKMARCHGQGPVFRECDVRGAIDESAVAGGRDELI